MWQMISTVIYANHDTDSQTTSTSLKTHRAQTVCAGSAFMEHSTQTCSVPELLPLFWPQQQTRKAGDGTQSQTTSLAFELRKHEHAHRAETVAASRGWDHSLESLLETSEILKTHLEIKKCCRAYKTSLMAFSFRANKTHCLELFLLQNSQKHINLYSRPLWHSRCCRFNNF